MQELIGQMLDARQGLLLKALQGLLPGALLDDWHPESTIDFKIACNSSKCHKWYATVQEPAATANFRRKS